MIIRDKEQNLVGIKCDLCPVKAPPAKKIMEAHGLNRLGWWCSGGRHLCPAHPHPKD